ncbi:hypothetical protein [Oricola indica]|uniref:hypothetical protein n=1 Tax=Oricola indica TaxID=2872591 RepID=UPI003CCBDBD0
MVHRYVRSKIDSGEDNSPKRTWRRIGEDDWAVPGIGRVYRYEHGPQQGEWFWSCTADIGDRSAIKCEGAAPLRDEAMRRVREIYEALKSTG